MAGPVLVSQRPVRMADDETNAGSRIAVVYGALAGELTPLPVGDVLAKGLTVRGYALFETTDVVERSRRVKDADEIAAIRRACSYGDRALEQLLGELREGMTEVEVAAVLEDRMRRAGSEGLSFDTIAAFGEQAAEPHHHPGGRRLARGDMIKEVTHGFWPHAHKGKAKVRHARIKQRWQGVEFLMLHASIRC